MIRFFIVLFCCGLFVGVGGILAQRIFQLPLPSFFFPTLILVVVSTGILYRYLYRASRQYFVQLYLLSIAIKMLAYGAYIFAIAIKDKPGAFLNVVFFMSIYIALTALEIGFLYRKTTHS